jgi:hypothetical protein
MPQLARLSAAVAAAALSACASTAPPPPVVIGIDVPPPILPAECRTAGDPAWTDVPDADIRRRQSVGLWEVNRRAFHQLAASRTICAAALAAHFDKPNPRGRRAEPAE